MVAPFGPSPGVARVVSLRSLRVPPRHYLPGTAWGKVQESGGSSDALERPWDPAAVTGPDPLRSSLGRDRCVATSPSCPRPRAGTLTRSEGGVANEAV